jgi:hypothetical protein
VRRPYGLFFFLGFLANLSPGIVPGKVSFWEGFVVDLANPFPLHEWVEPGLPMGPPVVYDVEVRGITIQNFRNNGLFTERVDGFTFVDVETNHIPGYGIFPTLSKNGSIRQSRASGSDDSGICAPAPGLTFPWMANPGLKAPHK